MAFNQPSRKMKPDYNPSKLDWLPNTDEATVALMRRRKKILDEARTIVRKALEAQRDKGFSTGIEGATIKSTTTLSPPTVTQERHYERHYRLKAEPGEFQLSGQRPTLLVKPTASISSPPEHGVYLLYFS